MTANEILEHPWVTGENALNVNISKSVSSNLKSIALPNNGQIQTQAPGC